MKSKGHLYFSALGIVQHIVGAAGQMPCLVRQCCLWVDKNQPIQSQVLHGSRHGTNVACRLCLNKNYGEVIEGSHG